MEDEKLTLEVGGICFLAFLTPTPSTRRLALWTGDSSTAGWGEEGKVRGARSEVVPSPGSAARWV